MSDGPDGARIVANVQSSCVEAEWRRSDLSVLAGFQVQTSSEHRIRTRVCQEGLPGTRRRPELFSVIGCDECHRALAPSRIEVIDHFKAKRRGDALLLGMTATPRRTDGRSALDAFDFVAWEIAKPELKGLGFLMPIQYWAAKAGLSLDQVKRSGGDFQGGALSAVINMRQVRALTLRACEDKAKVRKTLAFCASVRHAHRLAADFAARRRRAVVLDGRTRNRDEILDRFRRGDVELLLSYNVLTEAFDARRRTRWGLAPSSADQGG